MQAVFTIDGVLVAVAVGVVFGGVELTFFCATSARWSPVGG
jgi:hypothetical protein